MRDNKIRILKKISNKKNFSFLFLFFIFGCSDNVLVGNLYQQDKRNKIFQDLLNKTFSNVEKTDSVTFFFKNLKLSNITQDDIKKLDNINISEDSLLDSIPEPKIELTDMFKKENMEVTIVKDSVVRDKTNNLFTYKVEVTQNKLYRILTIEY